LKVVKFQGELEAYENLFLQKLKEKSETLTTYRFSVIRKKGAKNIFLPLLVLHTQLMAQPDAVPFIEPICDQVRGL
jgi:hypothetical protein